MINRSYSRYNLLDSFVKRATAAIALKACWPLTYHRVQFLKTGRQQDATWAEVFVLGTPETCVLPHSQTSGIKWNAFVMSVKTNARAEAMACFDSWKVCLFVGDQLKSCLMCWVAR